MQEVTEAVGMGAGSLWAWEGRPGELGALPNPFAVHRPYLGTAQFGACPLPAPSQGESMPSPLPTSGPPMSEGAVDGWLTGTCCVCSSCRS